MGDKWVRRWDVPSASDADTTYVVAIDAEGNYGCSCPRWKFRRLECHHIAEVKAGIHAPRGKIQKREPEIVLAIVRAVIAEVGDDGETVERVLTPLIPIGDTHFQATVIYDLFNAGVSWGTLKKRYDVAKRNSLKKVVAYVEERGRRIYGPLTRPCRPGLQTYETISVERKTADA